MININGNLEIEYKVGQIEKYVLEILTLGLAKVFFQASFIVENERIVACYKTNGFRRLSSVSSITTEELFSIIINLLRGINECEKHYIFFDEFDINDETVFIDKGCSETKITYIRSCEEKTGQEKMIELMEEMMKKSPSEGHPYIESALDYIKTKDFNFSGIIHYFENLRKEVYLCGIS